MGIEFHDVQINTYIKVIYLFLKYNGLNLDAAFENNKVCATNKFLLSALKLYPDIEGDRDYHI